MIDPERYLADAEAAVERAKQQGRNRVVRMDGLSQAAHTRASQVVWRSHSRVSAPAPAVSMH